jgi:DNA-binding beta-propeller fold protein YncE
VCVAPDDVVFVADTANNRVQVLTPHLDFHGLIGAGSLEYPVGVCANADVVVVSEYAPGCRVAVFNRRDGSLALRFGSRGSRDGQLDCPLGLCFLAGGRHVAVADFYNDRVAIFSVDGKFVENVGEGVLNRPRSVAASAFDELVVADLDNRRVVLFSASGDVVLTMVRDSVRGVAVHGCTVFAQDFDCRRCVVFT